MNQPKFKFGDKVIDRNHQMDEAFKVDEIVFRDGVFRYPDENADMHYEYDLELYQEPKRKRLYAYCNRDDVVFFSKEEDATISDDDMGFLMERAPEFDIEYPEVK